MSLLLKQLLGWLLALVLGKCLEFSCGLQFSIRYVPKKPRVRERGQNWAYYSFMSCLMGYYLTQIWKFLDSCDYLIPTVYMI